MPSARRTTGPGRVNLIGDHTDYNLGVALPMAIGLGVTVELTPSESGSLRVASDAFPGEEANLELERYAREPAAIAALEPAWLRPVAAMASLAPRPQGGTLRIVATLPVGAGLSSSAALCVAVADVFGVAGTAVDIARLCQEAERRAGSPVGAMDPLVCAGGRAGHALLIDFSTMHTRHVPMPADAEVVVVDSGRVRTVRGSGYAERVSECRAAETIVGPLGTADLHSADSLGDPVLRRRARHVVSECSRVRECADALAAGELAEAGRLMLESHRSLADDFDVSTPEMDELVARLASLDGVFGARMTGAGFGGCAVLLSRPGAVEPGSLPTRAWRVEPVDGTLASNVGGAVTTREEGRAGG